MAQRFSTQHNTHTHTHNGARVIRELFASSSGTDLDGGTGGRAESTTMRCDANETCWGNTVLCILRCAFWNRNRLSRFWLFVFLVGFSFSCLDCPFVPIWANQKRARTSITCILSSSSSSSYRKGGAGRDKAGATCAYFWSPGKYRGIISLSCEPVSFIIQPCCCVFAPTIPNPPVLFLASGPPPTRSRGPGFPFPPPFHPSLSNTQPDTPGRREMERVVFSSEWFGRDGGLTGGRGVRIWECVGRKRKTPLPLGTKPSAEFFNVGMGARRRRRRTATTGMDRQEGLLAWIRSQGKKFAMLTCDEQDVSAQPGCLFLSLSAYLRRGWRTGQPRPGSSKGKRNGGKPQRPTSSLPQRERERHRPPSFERLETRRLLVQSLLFTSQRHNHTDISFNFPLPHNHTCRPPLPPPLPRRPPRVVWFSAAGAPRDEVGRAGVC